MSNLWHSRSEELAGKLPGGDLPAQAELRAIEVYAQPSLASRSNRLDEIRDPDRPAAALGAQIRQVYGAFQSNRGLRICISGGGCNQPGGIVWKI
jgi:hypothetical protein